jgi:phenylacetate-CoA ligase
MRSIESAFIPEGEKSVLWNVSAETMPRGELEALQLRRLRETLTHVYEKVPLYRQRFETHGVRPESLHSLDDLSKFPFTFKKDLRDTYPFGMFAVPLKEVARIHGSSGTKGKPTVVGYTRQDLDVWAELIARCIAAAGGQPGDILHNAYGYGLFTGGLGLHTGAEKMGVTVVPASGGFTKRQITLIQDFRPQGICCTPSYALNIAETMDEMGIDTSSLSLRYGIFGAEPWTEHMRARLEQMLGLDAVDIYGLSEVMGPGVGIECAVEKNGLHIWEDHFLFEVVHPDSGQPLPPGEVGEVVFTSLTKQAFPVIRYRTGDLAAMVDEPCSCGRTHRRMTRIKGRVDDMLIIRGVNVFPREVEAELLAVEWLAPHYQIVIDKEGALDTMEVHVESRQVVDDADGNMVEMVAQNLQERIQIRPRVVIHPPGSLPRSEGKAVRVLDRRTAPVS